MFKNLCKNSELLLTYFIINKTAISIFGEENTILELTVLF